MSPDPQMPDPQAIDAWRQILDQLEAALQTPDAEAWHPPVPAGPLPSVLRDRAARLLSLQRRRADELGREASALSSELRLLRAADPGAGLEPARYLDATT